MALTSWKTFDFFTVSDVPFPEGGSWFQQEVTSLTTGSSNLFLGSHDGTVRVLSSSFKVLRTFQAYESQSITHMTQIDGTALLATIGEDLSSEPVLKVWDLAKTEKKTGFPPCLSTTQIQNGRRTFPVSAFVALDNLSQVAVGFANGSVTVIRGDLIHDRGAKQRTVFESEEPITALEVRQSAITTLHISTTSRILTLVISGRGQGQPARSIEDSGCGVGCMTADAESGDIVIAREDAIYSYSPRGRGPRVPFEGPKKLIRTFKDYVGVVCPPKVAQLSKTSGGRRFGTAQADDLFNSTSFTLLDTDLRYVAHSETMLSDIKYIFVEWSDLFIVTNDGKIRRYKEKSLPQKLEILYQRNLFILAINMAQKVGVDVSQQNLIFRRYGDHLFQKGDYDTAMQQYLRAIDTTEPSQIIRKFLDTQRIHNLIEYLEELHDHDKATADHTTLLLNCYAKLKDTDKLDSFIKAPGELKFDLDTAINMCRQGGYFEQAAYLATKHGENDLVVDILIEDSKKYAEAVHYIWRLDPELAYTNLMKYARVLLEHAPDETTQLFIDYYTGIFTPKRDIEEPEASEVEAKGALSAVQNLAALLPLRYMTTPFTSSSAPAQAEVATETISEPEPSTDFVPYDTPKPRTAFSSFVDHPVQFITFLEALLAQPELSEGDKVDLYTTLFEMYLDSANTVKDTAAKTEWENKAKSLIHEDDISISTSNVLLLSSLSNFRSGTTLVREQQGLQSDIFRSYTSAKDTAGAIKALRRYGPDQPSLYIDALSYFASSPDILHEAGEELDHVLQKIDEGALLPPAMVVQTLSRNGVVSMGLVKKYLSGNISRERKEIENNRRLISSYRTETATRRTELSALTSPSQPTVFQARRCSACSAVLDLPTVHFLCKHSFHRRCLNAPMTSASLGSSADEEEDLECPLCAPANKHIVAIRNRQAEMANEHGLFKDEMSKALDGERFGFIGEWFGRGVLSGGSVE